MITKLLTYRTGIVIVLITAISSVFVCQALCDLDLYGIKHNCYITNDVTNHVNSDSKESHSSVSHNHDSENTHSNHHQIDIDCMEPANHHSDHNDDCCEDMKTQIFESFIIQKTDIPSMEAKLFVFFDIELPFYRISFENRLTDFFKFYSDSSPPINGQKIIVIVQSFLL